MSLPVSAPLRRLAIYSFSDSAGIVDDYVPHLLQDLRRNVERLLVVCSGPLTEVGRAKLAPIASEILEREAKGDPTFPFTTGRNKFDFIDIDDLARMIAASVLQKDMKGIINCCSGEPVSLAEKVEAFLKEHHLKIRPVYGAFPDRPYDSPAIWGDATKINIILGKEKVQK